MINLPKDYEARMEVLLGDEFPAYQASLEETPCYGIRANTLKVTPGKLKELLPYSLEEVPWTDNGFYYTGDVQPGKHPLYYAGLYYIQEPSAMLPAALLPVTPGDRVLDLCGAPGGKTTELGAKLQGKGLLVSNDISPSRAKAMVKNIQMAGIRNDIVTVEPPERLAEQLPDYFDKILVDAPCSGEGMFRRNPRVMAEWEKSGPDYYAPLQRQILEEAYRMLKPGGMLLYSTCTFSPLEDEENVALFLQTHKDMNLVPVEHSPGMEHGRPEWVREKNTDLQHNRYEQIEKEKMNLQYCVRIWPHKAKGEGHFAALFQKDGDGSEKNISKSQPEQKRTIEERMQTINDIRYLLPEEMPDLRGLRVLQRGLRLGEEKRGGLSLAQSLANALKPEEWEQCVDLALDDINVIKYLKGETIFIPNTSYKGWVLVMTGGFPLGWAKASNGTLKNKYLSSWRML